MIDWVGLADATATTLAVIGGAWLLISWLAGSEVERRDRNRRAAKSEESTNTGEPYRTPSERDPGADSVDGANADVPLRPFTIDYHAHADNGALAFDCPRCGFPWETGTLGESGYCECDECSEGHFHMICGNVGDENDNDGCGARWIMKARPEATQPIDDPKTQRNLKVVS